jgi:hypothetical protein
MATQWIHRINIIAPADDADALNALWTVIAPGGDAEAQTFGLPLSPNGAQPVTYRGISTAATEIMRLLIVDTFSDVLVGTVVSVQPYTQNNWDDFLSTNGLQIVQEYAP